MEKMNKSIVLGATAMLALATCSMAAVAPFEHGFEGDALPEAASPAWSHPWTSAGASSSSDGDILTITTNTASDLQEYQLTSSEWNPNGSGSTIEFRARTVTNLGGMDWAGMLGISTGTQSWSFLIGENYITGPGGDFAYNTTAFHTYRLVIENDTAAAPTAIALYIDNDTTPARTWNSSSTASKYLSFGDNSTGNLAGTIEWDYIRWTNAGAFAPVPEPTSLAVLGLGALALAGRRRRA